MPSSEPCMLEGRQTTADHRQRGTVLLIEETHGAAAEFQRLGFTVERHAHRAINTGLTNCIPQKIKQRQYTALWSEFPITGPHIRAERAFAHMSQLCAWARLCADVGIPFILFGSFGKKWADPQLRVMIEDRRLHVSYHRLCHFGLKVDSTQQEPSSTCFVSASSFSLPSHCCRCGVAKEAHKLDGNAPPASSQDKLRLRAQIAICGKLIDKLSDIFDVGALRNAPDSTNNNLIIDPLTTQSGDQTSELSPAARCRALQNTRARAKNQRAVTFFGDPVASPPSHSLGLPAQPVFPTASRERQKVMQKARKLAGGTATKRKFVIEDHFDDCGTDLSGLGPDIVFFAADIFVELPACDSGLSDTFANSLAVWWLRGSEWQSEGVERHPPHTRLTHSIHEMMVMLAATPAGDDVVELRGGASRNAVICFHRHLPSGDCFDAVAHCDLNDPAEQGVAMELIHTIKPLVAVMAPCCVPFGPLASLEYISNYERWLASYLQAAPFGRFCGHVALAQNANGCHFINQQPFPSWLYQESPWPQVLALPTVSSELVHQCMTGKVAGDGNPVIDPIGFVANHSALLQPLRQFKCDGLHPHSSRTSSGQMWTWSLASGVADGIAAVQKLQHTSPAFPSVGVGPDDVPGPGAGDEAWRGCPGCLWRRTKTDASHNRVPDVCKHPLVESITWECPGCTQYKITRDDNHTCEPGKCKFHSQQSRLSSQRRRGKHPREPSTPAASQQPTSRRNCQVGPTLELEMKQQQHQLHQRRPLPPRPRLALMAAARPTLQVQNLELRELAEDPIRSHAYAARSETMRLERQRGAIGLDLTLGHRCVRCGLALPRPFSASYANYIYDGGTLA